MPPLPSCDRSSRAASSESRPEQPCRLFRVATGAAVPPLPSRDRQPCRLFRAAGRALAGSGRVGVVANLGHYRRADGDAAARETSWTWIEPSAGARSAGHDRRADGATLSVFTRDPSRARLGQSVVAQPAPSHAESVGWRVRRACEVGAAPATVRRSGGVMRSPLGRGARAAARRVRENKTACRVLPGCDWPQPAQVAARWAATLRRVCIL